MTGDTKEYEERHLEGTNGHEPPGGSQNPEGREQGSSERHPDNSDDGLNED